MTFNDAFLFMLFVIALLMFAAYFGYGLYERIRMGRASKSQKYPLYKEQGDMVDYRAKDVEDSEKTIRDTLVVLDKDGKIPFRYFPFNPYCFKQICGVPCQNETYEHRNHQAVREGIVLKLRSSDSKVSAQIPLTNICERIENTDEAFREYSDSESRRANYDGDIKF